MRIQALKLNPTWVACLWCMFVVEWSRGDPAYLTYILGIPLCVSSWFSLNTPLEGLLTPSTSCGTVRASSFRRQSRTSWLTRHTLRKASRTLTIRSGFDSTQYMPSGFHQSSGTDSTCTSPYGVSEIFQKQVPLARNIVATLMSSAAKSLIPEWNIHNFVLELTSVLAGGPGMLRRREGLQQHPSRA